jgi:hypothetical protein
MTPLRRELWFSCGRGSCEERSGLGRSFFAGWKLESKTINYRGHEGTQRKSTEEPKKDESKNENKIIYHEGYR